MTSCRNIHLACKYTFLQMGMSHTERDCHAPWHQAMHGYRQRASAKSWTWTAKMLYCCKEYTHYNLLHTVGAPKQAQWHNGQQPNEQTCWPVLKTLHQTLPPLHLPPWLLLDPTIPNFWQTSVMWISQSQACRCWDYDITLINSPQDLGCMSGCTRLGVDQDTAESARPSALHRYLRRTGYLIMHCTVSA